MRVDFKLENGQRVRDKVSGMIGVVDCCALWLNGCRRYSVQPPLKEGETSKPDSWWIDEEQLELVDNGVIGSVNPSKTGGPSSRSNSAR